MSGLLRAAGRVDRTQSDPVVAGRNTLGVSVPLVIGALHGSAALGLASTIGALQTSFADRPGPYRLRMLRMGAVAVSVGVTSVLAVLCSGSNLASAALLLVLGFLAGLMLTAGPAATQLGVAATACALIIGHQPQSAGHALRVGLLVLAGGALQAALAIAAWPLRRHLPERRALAALYAGLAGLARHPPGTGVGPPLVAALAETRQTLYGLGHDHGPSVEAYRVLLDESGRIRRELLVLGGYCERLHEEAQHAAEAALRSALESCGDVLDEVATALLRGRPVDQSALDPVRARLAAVRDDLDGDPADRADHSAAATRRAASARLRTLAGQLRAAVETARTGATEGGRGDEDDDTYGVRKLRDPLAIVRANLAPDSAVLRHAVRLAVLLSVSDLVVRQVGVARGYWVPLTILVVLRPDFASTFQRGTFRVAGTIIGLLLATVLVHFVPGGQWYAIGLIAVFFFGMRLAGPANVGLSAVSLSALVVILLSLAGVSAHEAVVRRAVDTLIGGTLALVATLLWPVWEREVVAVRLAGLLSAYGDYALAVADLTPDKARMQKARAAARLARTNAQASVDRARSEPVSGHAEVELGDAVLANTHRFINAMLTIDALRPALRETLLQRQHGAGVPELEELLRRAAGMLDDAERSVRTGAVPPAWPDLRTAHEDLAQALGTAAHDSGDDFVAAVVEASDRIADSLDTLADELRRQLSEPVAP